MENFGITPLQQEISALADGIPKGASLDANENMMAKMLFQCHKYSLVQREDGIYQLSTTAEHFSDHRNFSLISTPLTVFLLSLPTTAVVEIGFSTISMLNQGRNEINDLEFTTFMNSIGMLQFLSKSLNIVGKVDHQVATTEAHILLACTRWDFSPFGNVLLSIPKNMGSHPYSQQTAILYDHLLEESVHKGFITQEDIQVLKSGGLVSITHKDYVSRMTK